MKKTKQILSFCVLTAVTSFVALFVFAGQANADSINGFIQLQAGSSDIYLLIKPDQPALKIQTLTPALMTDLQNLKTGDFIVGRGTLPTAISTPDQQNVVQLESIESVGLTELLGSWRSDNWEVFEFKDFTQLNLYQPTPNLSGPALQKTGQFQYVLAPDQGDRYSIFLSDDHSIQVGSIEFNSTGIALTVFDSQTGKVSQNISLSPIPAQ
jgi:hypothetical protein